MKEEYKVIGFLMIIVIILGGFILLSTIMGTPAVASEVEDIPLPTEESPEFDGIEKMEHTYEITEAEREMIEHVVAAEARGEKIEGMVAVAQTIRDRCMTREQRPMDVCQDPYQYAEPYEGEVSEKVEDAVMFVFDYGHSALAYPTTHFYAHTLIDEPEWSQGMTTRGTIGDHTFYYEGEEKK
jgi:hypothetical protein